MWKSPEELKCSVLLGEPKVGPEWLEYKVNTGGKSETEARACEWAGLRRALNAMKRAQRRKKQHGHLQPLCEKEQDGLWTPPGFSFWPKLC